MANEAKMVGDAVREMDAGNIALAACILGSVIERLTASEPDQEGGEGSAGDNSADWKKLAFDWQEMYFMARAEITALKAEFPWGEREVRKAILESGLYDSHVSGIIDKLKAMAR